MSRNSIAQLARDELSQSQSHDFYLLLIAIYDLLLEVRSDSMVQLGDCVDRRSAGVPAQCGTVCTPQRQSTKRRRHQARNVEVGRICFRCSLQPRPTDGNRLQAAITINR